MTASRSAPSWFDKCAGGEQTRNPAWLGAPARARHSSVRPAERQSLPPSKLAAVPAASPPPPVVSAELEALHSAERALAESEAALVVARAEADEARSAVTKLHSEHAEAAETMRQTVTTMRDEAERELVKLAIAVAERVVARELTSAPELIVDWAREAIVGSALGDQLEVVLSSTLSSCIGEAAWGDLAQLVSVDLALPPGTCELRDGGKVVTVNAETRLGLVSDHLSTVADREAA